MAVGDQKSVLFMRDFTGGLNNSSPAQQLRLNETPDCLDVTFDAAGGFSARAGLACIDVFVEQMKAIGAYSTISADWALFQSASSGQLIGVSLGVDYDILHSSLTSTSDQVRLGLYGGNAYFANTRVAGVVQMKKWDGTGAPSITLTTLGNAFVDNYTTPTGGNMPKAAHIANHQGYMWVANTVESGVTHPSRVRFSHPLRPEDWATDDYIDVDPTDVYDEVTGIVPFDGALMVFKRRAVYAIYGSDSSNFVVQRLAGTVGAVSREAVATGITSIYWWSTDGNMMAFDGKTIEAIGQRVTGPVKNGDIIPGADAKVVWHSDDVLHVCVPTAAGGFYHFVYFANVGRSGAWARYSWRFTTAVYGRKKTGETYCYFGIPQTFGSTNVHYESSTVTGVDEVQPTVMQPFQAYWTSPWLTAGETATLKRWRRARITAFADAVCTLKFDVFHDYDELSTRRRFEMPLLADLSSPGGVWGEDWGTMVWAARTSRRIRSFLKLPVLGKSHAVSFKLRVADNSGGWSVDSIALPYERAAVK